MTINLIDLDTVKLNLGITETLNDAKLTALIPIVSADVRRILNCQFDSDIAADFTNADNTLDAVCGIPVGTVLYHPNLPDNTYVVSFDSYDTLVYTMSNTPTGTGDYVNPTINISQQSTISKMIWYRLKGQTTTDVNRKRVSSESIGSVSYTYADSEINSDWNYPQILIDDLGSPYAEVG